MPDVCVRRWCTVTFLSICAKLYGSMSHSKSSSDNFPASISLQVANPVNSFVPDAIPKPVSLLFGSLSLRLRKPQHFSKTTSYSLLTENTPENAFMSSQLLQFFRSSYSYCLRFNMVIFRRRSLMGSIFATNGE